MRIADDELPPKPTRVPRPSRPTTTESIPLSELTPSNESEIVSNPTVESKSLTEANPSPDFKTYVVRYVHS